jgi:hypothetical protein
MSLNKGVRIMAALTTRDHGPVSLTTLCQASLDLVAADGVSLALMGGSVQEAATASSEGLGAASGDLEFALGEGPGTDAYAQGRPVLVADIRRDRERWPLYARAAEDVGLRAVYALPLQIGAAKLGLLRLYREEAGPLTEPELREAIAVADALSEVVLGLQAAAEPGTLAGALEDGTVYRAVVHQATGVLAAQLDCAVQEALLRLRAVAFATDRSLADVATDVVSGVLKIER